MRRFALTRHQCPRFLRASRRVQHHAAPRRRRRNAGPAPPVEAPAPPPAPKPQLGSFGFDETGMDKTVAPGADFYGFANGTWAKNTPIPADKSNYACSRRSTIFRRTACAASSTR